MATAEAVEAAACLAEGAGGTCREPHCQQLEGGCKGWWRQCPHGSGSGPEAGAAASAAGAGACGQGQELGQGKAAQGQPTEKGTWLQIRREPPQKDLPTTRTGKRETEGEKDEKGSHKENRNTENNPHC